MRDISLKVYVAHNNYGMDVDIAIVTTGAISQLAKVIDDGHLQFSPIQQGQWMPPTIRLSRDMAQELLAGLLALNIPSPSAGAVEGELKATKIHLEDMRQLLKITKIRP